MANLVSLSPKPQPGRNGQGGNGLATTNNVTPARGESIGQHVRANIEYLSNPNNFRDGGIVNRPVVSEVKVNAGDLLYNLARGAHVEPGNAVQFGISLFDRANQAGMTVSDYLEFCDPSDRYTGPVKDMDAFERQLMVAGIRAESRPEKGIYADKVERFFQSNVPGSQVLFPEFINRVMRESLIAPDTLQFMIALNTGIDGGDYRTIYTNDTATTRRLARVNEGTEFPTTVLDTQEHAIHIQKTGRKLRGTYEFFRKVRIDLFTIMLRRIAMQAMLDKADSAAYVAINGDGNSNTATNYNQSTLDTGVVPTYTAFTAFGLNFYPYRLSTIIGNQASLTKFLSMSRPSIDPFQVMAILQQLQLPNQAVTLPQDIFGGINLVLLPNMTSGVFLGLDKRFALEQVTENGASLVETDRIISQQFNDIVISERVGYGQIFNPAIATWTWNA